MGGFTCVAALLWACSLAGHSGLAAGQSTPSMNRVCNDFDSNNDGFVRITDLLNLLSYFNVECEADDQCPVDPFVVPTPAHAPADWAPLDLPEPFAGKEWADILAEARGGRVEFHMWSGSDSINDWVDGWLTDRLYKYYGVELVRTPVTYESGIMNVVGDVAAGHDEEVRQAQSAFQDVTSGNVGLVWINGANFRAMREQDTLFGPFAPAIPSGQYYDFDSGPIAYDFGYPTDGYEMPYNSAQSVFIYNTAHIAEADVPMTLPDLASWIVSNPGMFKYSQPPSHFTGSMIVRHFFYWFAGEGLGGGASWADFGGAFNETLYAARAPAVWAQLNALEPYLHGYNSATGCGAQGADCYPADHAVVNDLFAAGDISYEVSYNRNAAANAIVAGTWPATAQAYVLTSGTIANTNFVAIPKNAPNKAASMVAANVIGSGQAMLTRSRPHVWGALQGFDPAALSDEQLRIFNKVDTHPSAPSESDLLSSRLGELNADYVTRIESDWVTFVRDQ